MMEWMLKLFVIAERKTIRYKENTMERLPSKPEPTKPEKKITSVSLDHELVERVDAECKRTGLDRSKLFTAVLEMYLALEETSST